MCAWEHFEMTHSLCNNIVILHELQYFIFSSLFHVSHIETDKIHRCSRRDTGGVIFIGSSRVYGQDIHQSTVVISVVVNGNTCWRTLTILTGPVLWVMDGNSLDQITIFAYTAQPYDILYAHSPAQDRCAHNIHNMVSVSKNKCIFRKFL